MLYPQRANAGGLNRWLVFEANTGAHRPAILAGSRSHASKMLSTASGNATVISTHFASVRRGLSDTEVAAVQGIVEALAAARDRGAFIYVAGNGGSASTASHWVNDLGKATKRSGYPPLKVMCLSDNVSWFSALSNDEGYEEAFAGQLDNFATPGDVLICISASGNSLNLVRAVELARERKLRTLALVGFDGGVLGKLVDTAVCVHSEKGAYELVEDVHSIICHAITRCLTVRRLGSNG